ncbi:SecD export membrane protein [Nitrosococcus oceani ATCC 19707]|uniref:Protein translocase subunit SecD n=2 Tax=Nitrosococcus oceani TaxID=1229 RepID=Q3J8N8_NITOC|nr:protein translocase subunit SecD [Nitrosococcus oceani]ABA58808.1 SecD export membrane protein [Nitrosococcus oceani ATCC 19707]EDZ66685.1 protein-export membrane protein SecD [Nitrosococcus oceani AFC27]KFI18616.1 preprotein translocase subunit SecD [Nitrosococcus oceani C-27]GEM19102.1 protein translocase subunit SecD [Nitrosococcus oceani]
MNRYPLWKNLLVVAVVLVGILYAVPNLFGDTPALQISATRGASLKPETLARVERLLQEQGLDYQSVRLEDQRLLVRLRRLETQLKAQDALRAELGSDYSIALHLSPATPDWLRAIGGLPMNLGLDLRGGVHFLMEVDMEAAVQQAEERYVEDLRSLLRENKIRYLSIGRLGAGGVEIKFRNEQQREQAETLIHDEYFDLLLEPAEGERAPRLEIKLSEKEQREIQRLALQQNITTLRNRINELGVAEPTIQQQGENRIVVQLPGVQDTARAKEILGATATLEFRLVDTSHDVQRAVEGRVPVGSRLYHERGGAPILLKKRVILTGDHVTDASSGIEQQGGSPAVFVSLDGQGARHFSQVTGENIGKPMAVVFIETKSEIRMEEGEPVKVRRRVPEVINVATIRDQLSKRFQITGLDSTEEARNLALLLRAGALAAPIDIVEERTIGPSLGQDNIDKGFQSVLIGFALVLVFMALYYRVFGLVANLALAANLVLVVSLLSMLQATLTLPGIAGIVLTVGMAVDANVLIFERIREELRNGSSPQASIEAGYANALSTIVDANITTLITAVVLFGFGTGPIKGFAVTLSLGILTSMFTAIVGTRAVINLIYGRRRKVKLSI